MPRDTENYPVSEETGYQRQKDPQSAVYEYHGVLDEADSGRGTTEFRAVRDGRMDQSDLSWNRERLRLDFTEQDRDIATRLNRVDPDTLAGKMYFTLEDAADEMPPDHHEAVSRSITYRLTHHLEERGVDDLIPPDSTRSDDPLRSTAQALRERSQEVRTMVYNSLETRDSTAYLYAVEQVQDLSHDLKSAQEGRPGFPEIAAELVESEDWQDFSHDLRSAQEGHPDFQEIAAELTRSKDWRDVLKPGNEDQLLEAVSSLRFSEDWSGPYYQDVVNDLADSVAAESRVLAGEFPDDPEMDLYVNERTNSAEMSLRMGMDQYDHDMYQEGRRMLELTVAEAKAFREEGRVPEGLRYGEDR